MTREITTDVRARAEEDEIVSGRTLDDQRSQAQVNQLLRDERFQDNWGRVQIAALWLGAIVFTVMVGVWLLHLIGHGWLTDIQFERLQSFVTGGLITNAVAAAFKRRLR